MKRYEFRKVADRHCLVLDGATGTLLQSRGMAPGVCPELFALEHPELLGSAQNAYAEAGSHILYTFTFGGNVSKLSHYGIDAKKAYDINRELAMLSGSVRDERKRRNPDKPLWVAGDMGPTGHFLKPAGDMTSEEMLTVYRRQAKALLDGGVDLFAVETMMDLSEACLALLAIRELCDLPVIVTMTFGEKGKTLSGNGALECLLTLEDAGADAFGANCSTGPEQMIPLLAGLGRISALPLVAKPNAGMPVIENGQNVFPMKPEAFAGHMQALVLSGIRLAGGCCGTSPEHIRSLSDGISRLTVQAVAETRLQANLYCSARVIVDLDAKPDIAAVRITRSMDSQQIEERMYEALDEEPDLLVLDLSECHSNPSEGFLTPISDAIRAVCAVDFTPLAILGCPETAKPEIRKAYCGKLAWLSLTEYNNLLKQ